MPPPLELTFDGERALGGEAAVLALPGERSLPRPLLLKPLLTERLLGEGWILESVAARWRLSVATGEGDPPDVASRGRSGGW